MAENGEQVVPAGCRALQDSGVGSFGSESDSSPVLLQGAMSAAHNNASHSLPQAQSQQPQNAILSPSATGRPGSAFHSVCSSSLPPKLVNLPTPRQQFTFEPLHEQACVEKDLTHCVVTENDNVSGSCTKEMRSKEPGKMFHVTYLGSSILDRRYTQPMLPWIMAEVRRSSMKRLVSLQVIADNLTAIAVDSDEILFEHKLQTLSRFARTHRDPGCFAYLTRANPDSLFTCQVFQASEGNVVPKLFSTIREATKEAMKDHNSNPQSASLGGGGGAGGEAPNKGPITHLCEVMYVGKMLVTSKKAPPTFIDEAVERFKEAEEKKKEEGTGEDRQRHYSGSSIRSLPADLERSVSLQENRLRSQSFQEGSCDITAQGAAAAAAVVGAVIGEDVKEHASDQENDNCPHGGSTDSIPLGGSSSGTALREAVRRAQDCDGADGGDDRFTPTPNAAVDGGHDINKTMTSQGHVGADGGHDTDNLHKMVLQGQNNQCRKNRTMLIQVGDKEVCLISPDRKRVIFERKFKDISFCSQGIRHPEHFGFISRDASNNHFLCYVFCCATESLVEEVMQTLKQAFHAAYQQNAKNYVVCELCPMHQLNKLCQEIDKLSAEEVHEILIRKVEQLNEADRNDVMTKYRLDTACTIPEKNEALMAILRHMCEEKQESHVHLSDSNRAQVKYEFILTDIQNNNSIGASKFDQFKTKARKSLTSSFENMLHRSRHVTRREESRDAFKQRSWTTESDSSQSQSFDSSATETPELTPVSSPLYKDVYTHPPPHLPHPPLGGAEHMAHMMRRPRTRSTSSLPVRERGWGAGEAEGRGGGEPERRMDRDEPDLGRMFFGDSPLKTMFTRVASSLQGSPLPSNGSSTSASQSFRAPSWEESEERSPGQKSWRLNILHGVVTPSRVPRPRPAGPPGSQGLSQEAETNEQRRLLKQRVRHLWKKAILETLLLIRMERENKNLQGRFVLYGSRSVVLFKARQDEVDTRRLKLDYEEVTPCLIEVTKVWDAMLLVPARYRVTFDLDKVTNATRQGVPRTRRGDIWQLLVEQHRLHNPGLTLSCHGDNDLLSRYDDLLKQLTVHQHAILIDLGRTFPGHPYFMTQLGPGQLSLFNLLKAYSLMDKEVGYCQGLSFVAGILLMHMPEEQAFETMKYMMFQLGFRRQYRPDMVALQIQLYQLSRLLHDHHRDLYDHLERHEIAPTLYAAPWFLTIFASQFPLGFVARVFDLIFLQGIEVVFKVALVLLGNHKELIKQCNSFETVVEFLKTTLPSMGIIQMERVINQVFQLDVSKQLHAYEVEYHVLQEEMAITPHRAGPHSNRDAAMERLETANQSLKRQTMELLEQLQAARSQGHSLELQLHSTQAAQTKLQGHVRTLELERGALLNAVSRLRRLVPVEVLAVADVAMIPAQDGGGGGGAEGGANHLAPTSPIHNPLVSRFLEAMDVQLSSNSLTEVDREVAALLATRRKSDQPCRGAAPTRDQPDGQGQGRSGVKVKISNHLESEFHLSVNDRSRERPASSNY